MGSRVSRQERVQRETAKDRTFREAKEQVQRTYNDSKSVIPAYSMEHVIVETKLQQLDRRGHAFTKADLVAIAIRLSDPGSNIHQYRALSCDDLRAFIRLKLYSPETFRNEEGEEPGAGETGTNASVVPWNS